ncbi:hypothetical protein ACKU3Z_029820 [Pseudomonas aeruginosa]|nr:hypothetical protein [Pseudomonas aeruginosa]
MAAKLTPAQVTALALLRDAGGALDYQVDFDLAAKAFLELGNGENNESFRGFITNLRTNPAPEVPIATHYEG